MGMNVETDVAPSIANFDNEYSNTIPAPAPAKATSRRFSRHFETIRNYRDAHISSTLGPIRDVNELHSDLICLNNISHSSREIVDGASWPLFLDDQNDNSVLDSVNIPIAAFQGLRKCRAMTANASDIIEPDWVRPSLRGLLVGIREDASACRRNKLESTMVQCAEPHTGEDPPETRELARNLSGRHLQMIVIAGSIGTGLFVSTGPALAIAGPALLIIIFIIAGLMLFCTCRALGELAVLFPVPGSFIVYFGQFIDPAWGFALGWSYALSWLVWTPVVILKGVTILGFWQEFGSINPAVWVTLFLIIITFINLSGVRAFGEAEFIISAIKMLAIVGFLILGLVVDLGGGPHKQFIGARYWHDPGAFPDDGVFNAFLAIFPVAAFSFQGTELIGLCAAEADKPGESVPSAITHTFWISRIVFFYVTALVVTSLLVPFNDLDLLGLFNSPFIIALQNSGIHATPSIMNTVIFLAILSAGNSCIYGASRSLAALAAQNQAPAFLAYINRSGTPVGAILFSSAFGLLAYFEVTDPPTASMVIIWMEAICGRATLFSWMSICLCHIRFRRAWAVQGHDLEEIPLKSRASLMGSWIGFALNLAVLIILLANTRVWPAMLRAEFFFEDFLIIPVIVVTYLVYKFWKGTRIQRASTMDIKVEWQEHLTRESPKQDAEDGMLPDHCY